jgi:endoribonuclease LACTB2
MGPLARHLLETAARRAGGERLAVEEMPGGVLRLRLSSRMTRLNGLEVAAYLVGTILVDSGFVYLGRWLHDALRGREVSAIVLTHHHEDHSGSCGALAAERSCPVYLARTDRRFEEGVSSLAAYRVLWWGEPAPYTPLEMPPKIEAGGRALAALPTPGHSATHTVFLDETTGVVFTGDLFVSRLASAVMSHEDPFESVRSLRRLAALAPTLMLTGHALAVERPAELLSRKADAIERAAERVLELHARGTSEERLAREVFPSRGRAKDRFLERLTEGEFSRRNFVRACLRPR